jgi:hypothetical protein
MNSAMLDDFLRASRAREEEFRNHPAVNEEEEGQSEEPAPQFSVNDITTSKSRGYLRDAIKFTSEEFRELFEVERG